jgi:hypothetical protein
VTEVLNISVLLGELKEVSCFNESADIAAGNVHCHAKTDAKQTCSSKLFINNSGID